MSLQPQFVALLTFLTEKDGGRKTPAMSGYRPAIKFPFSIGYYTGMQNYIDADDVFPGDTVKAEITLLNTEAFKHQLYKGLDFEFFEGEALIGHGVILEILNPEFDATKR